MKLEYPRQGFKKYSDIKFHENPSCRSRVVSCGRTDMTKLIVAFCTYAKATEKKDQNQLRAELVKNRPTDDTSKILRHFGGRELGLRGTR